LLAAVSTASAQARCRVMDPTGTPLNVRASPGGRVIGNLPNGLLVSIMSVRRDGGGRPWAHVSRYDSGRRIGWVWREFLACF
jgi:hypothetical protein